MELPAELAHVAYEAYGETPEKLAACLQDLRSKVEGKVPDSMSWLKGDDYLALYLRWAKLDIGKALERIASTATFVKEYSEILGDPTKLRGDQFNDLYNQGFLCCLGRTTKSGAVINLLQPSKMAPLSDPNDFIRWNFWVLQRATTDLALQVKGMVILENFAGFSMIHMMTMKGIPQHIMKKNFTFMNYCAPFKLKGIWILNQPAYMSILFAIAKPFMSAKMKSRIRLFGSDFNKLHELIEPDVLPPAFGGTHPDSGREWFENEKRLETGQ
mmetsp:Transcript_36937/g.82127  ORF Transcript_36937/g.82127 Transcript_36937/m.82127 type:complete len:271 (+) Transcript_36937:151-963(+)|eukprot:CAMPEP_0202897636 /NCGR_PEP_ID=MMETSP1392-20130828/6341_1 /ASSEMBLY_ACC=CAM_ASM_000868 /TAXON_ID=225041 /ORGANISM="Chlamydomonas chlamydogama, Strain SAG 11-48b" /LENGTH=270 /DNA_ID=CAMNT_0049583321 /DNA_START=149 /DNA_END=961 /DNA_ORIENTATION=-